MTPIYITSFHRRQFTERCVREIHERTAPSTYEIHLYDNDSMTNKEDRDFAYGLLEKGLITSLHLDVRNTGCLYNKLIFHAMTTSDTPYYVITDNDVFPPKIEPDWLSSMISIMDENKSLALLAMQLPPQSFQGPTGERDDNVWYCKAVGNTFKLCRTEAMNQIIQAVPQKIGAYGDDSIVSRALSSKGWKVAFCKNIYCYHAGQCLNWGYTPEEVSQDPRKAGYGRPFVYPYDPVTYKPLPAQLRM